MEGGALRRPPLGLAGARPPGPASARASGVLALHAISVKSALARRSLGEGGSSLEFSVLDEFNASCEFQ